MHKVVVSDRIEKAKDRVVLNEIVLQAPAKSSSGERIERK